MKPRGLISKTDALLMMALPKTGTPSDNWREDIDHQGTRQMIFALRVTGRRDLVVEITARMHPVVQDRRIVDFGLFKSDPIFRSYDRVYQLTLDDKRFITHRGRDRSIVYGSHELVGDETIALPHFNDVSFATGLSSFLLNVNLTLEDGNIEDPFALLLK